MIFSKILEQTFRPGKLNPIVRQIYMVLFLIISIGQIYCSLIESESEAQFSEAL